MELSERMLKSYRACGIPCDVGILLNIAEDSAHFEGHESFEESLRTVSAVFRNAKTACVNLDTEHRRQVLAAAGSAERIVTFGTTGAPDIWGHAIPMENGKVTFRARCDRLHEKFTLAMPGASASARRTGNIPPMRLWFAALWTGTRLARGSLPVLK